MGIAYNTSIVREGLVLHLDAANIKSYPQTDTNWYDLSGNGHTFNMNNGPSFSSNSKGAIVFDGVNDNAVSTTITNLSTTGITASAWVNPIVASGTNDLETIVCRFNGSNQPVFRLYYGTWPTLGDTRPIFEIYNAGSFKGTTNGQQLLLNEWIKLDGIYSSENGGELLLFVNGSLVSTTSGVGSLATHNNDRIYIGSTDTILDTARFFCGANISQISLYNKALSEVEICQNFEAYRGRYSI